MKPQPILRDMPYRIKQNIVRHVDTLTKFSSLIRCSKEYKTLVDESPVCFERVAVSLIPDTFTVDFWRTAGLKKTSLSTSKHLAGDRFVDQSIESFMQLVGNPNFKFYEFFFFFYSPPEDVPVVNQLLDRLKTSVSNLGHKLSVKKVSVTFARDQDLILSILPVLKPGTLEDIYFSIRSGNDTSMEKLTDLRQWQLAKTISCGKINVEYSKWKHFQTSSLSVDRLTLDLVKSIIENFQKNPNIKRTYIENTVVDAEEIKGYLAPFHLCFEYYKVPIPEREENLKVKLGDNYIKVTRKLENEY